jgi:hypothetical protein
MIIAHKSPRFQSGDMSAGGPGDGRRSDGCCPPQQGSGPLAVRFLAQKGSGQKGSLLRRTLPTMVRLRQKGSGSEVRLREQGSGKAARKRTPLAVRFEDWTASTADSSRRLSPEKSTGSAVQNCVTGRRSSMEHGRWRSKRGAFKCEIKSLCCHSVML